MDEKVRQSEREATGGIRSEGKHESLISHATFTLVQTLLRKNRRNPAGAKGKK
jgi:hypothetical protein